LLWTVKTQPTAKNNINITASMEINQFYKLLFEDKCDDFIRYCEKHKEEINTNKDLLHPLNTLIAKIEREVETIPLKSVTKEWITILDGAHYGRILVLNNEQLEKITIAQIKIYRVDNLEKCLLLAKRFPNNAICKEVLETEIKKTNNIIQIYPKKIKISVLEKEDKPLSVKDRMKDSILEKLQPTSKRITIANLYDKIECISNDFTKDLFFTCLRELKKEDKIYFGDINNIYSAVHILS